jgi:hypothetical protein
MTLSLFVESLQMWGSPGATEDWATVILSALGYDMSLIIV